jgi:ribosome-associated protein
LENGLAGSKKTPLANQKSGNGRGSQAKRQTPRIATSHQSGPALPRPVRRAPSKGVGSKGEGKKGEGKGRPYAAKASEETRPAPRPKKAARLDAGPSLASDDARAMAILVAVAALEKKAVGIELLDVAGKIDYADFIVVMTGRSDRHVQALAQGIEEELRKKGKRPLSIEGVPSARWVLMDLGDVVVHVFQEDARGTYDIEGLWSDAKRVPIPDAPPN